MGAVLAIIILFALFSALDIYLKFLTLFSYRIARTTSEAMMPWLSRVVFAVLNQFAGFKTDYGKMDTSALPERFLVISNHQSLLDIPIMINFFGGKGNLRFVAKKELGKYIPFVSTILRYQRHALISRHGSMHETMDTLMSFVRACRRSGASPVIFPEGTRSRDREVHTFHSAGVRKILEMDPMPVAVVALEGGWRISNMKTIFKYLRGSSYRVRLLGIETPPTDRKEVVAFLADVKARVTAEVSRLRIGTRL